MVSGVGEHGDESGGREIPYFIVPIVAPVIGARAGAAIYRYFIGARIYLVNPAVNCKKMRTNSQQ